MRPSRWVLVALVALVACSGGGPPPPARTEGALLDRPLAGVPAFQGCGSAACERIAGSGGTFVVEVMQKPDGSRSVRLYGAGGEPVARTPEFPPGVEVFGISVLPGEVDGEPVAVVDYDFDGAGALHSFDVVAWEDGAPKARVVAFVKGTGQDQVSRRDGRLEFVSANFDDGAPTCCPTQADVRTLSHPGPGEWVMETRTVPMEEVP